MTTAMPEQSAVHTPPCGCARKKTEYRAAAERVEVVSTADVGDAALAQELTSQYFASLSWHEGGHVIVGLSFGRPIKYVTVGGNRAHVAWATDQPFGELNLWAGLAISTAGSLAEGIGDRLIVCPPADYLDPFITAGRCGTLGHCDRCQESRLLVAALPADPNDKLVRQWRDAFDLTANLLDLQPFRFGLRRVALALIEKTLLMGDEIDQLVDREELVEAQRRFE